MYIVLPSFSRLIHLTIQEDGIKRQSWLFLWENYHKKLFLKSEKTFLEYRAAKAAVVLLQLLRLASNSDGCCVCIVLHSTSVVHAI